MEKVTKTQEKVDSETNNTNLKKKEKYNIHVNNPNNLCQLGSSSSKHNKLLKNDI